VTSFVSASVQRDVFVFSISVLAIPNTTVYIVQNGNCARSCDCRSQCLVGDNGQKHQKILGSKKVETCKLWVSDDEK
jgi:hypothetical protein